jgi:hypothetical protein
MIRCRVMLTRRCPPRYHGPCGERPCARFESDDLSPWLTVLDAHRLWGRFTRVRPYTPRWRVDVFGPGYVALSYPAIPLDRRAR